VVEDELKEGRGKWIICEVHGKCGCAKAPRDNVFPKCIVLKQGLAGKEVAFVWAQREVDRSLEAERYRISPQRMPLLGHVA
jgi:hypothetical protein